jgi:hypothetical protein
MRGRTLARRGEFHSQYIDEVQRKILNDNHGVRASNHVDTSSYMGSYPEASAMAMLEGNRENRGVKGYLNGNRILSYVSYIRNRFDNLIDRIRITDHNIGRYIGNLYEIRDLATLLIINSIDNYRFIFLDGWGEIKDDFSNSQMRNLISRDLAPFKGRIVGELSSLEIRGANVGSLAMVRDELSGYFNIITQTELELYKRLWLLKGNSRTLIGVGIKKPKPKPKPKGKGRPKKIK